MFLLWVPVVVQGAPMVVSCTSLVPGPSLRRNWGAGMKREGKDDERGSCESSAPSTWLEELQEFTRNMLNGRCELRKYDYSL